MAKIKIRCRIATRNVQIIEMDTSNHLYELLDALREQGLPEKENDETKFTYNGKTFSMDSRSTFEKIGMLKDANIVVFNQAISGFIFIFLF